MTHAYIPNLSGFSAEQRGNTTITDYLTTCKLDVLRNWRDNDMRYVCLFLAPHSPLVVSLSPSPPPLSHTQTCSRSSGPTRRRKMLTLLLVYKSVDHTQRYLHGRAPYICTSQGHCLFLVVCERMSMCDWRVFFPAGQLSS
jgi:hypothetical protein